jgi:cytidylate kinase
MPDSKRDKVVRIAVCGGVCTGTSELLKEFARHPQTRDWARHSGGDSMRDIQIALGFDSISALHKSCADMDAIDREVDGRNRKFMLGGPRRILEARLAVEACEGLEGTLTVLLICDDEERIRREMKRANVDYETARIKVLARDMEDLNRYARLYGILNFADPARFDLVINSGRFSPSQIVEQILEEARRRERKSLRRLVLS